MQLIFADTNILVAMFKRPRSDVNAVRSLAREVLDVSLEENIDIVLTDVVVSEFIDVAKRDKRMASYLAKNQHIFELLPFVQTNKVSHETYIAIQQVSVDPKDVDILASIIDASQGLDDVYLLSNDMKNFHTDAMKAFLRTHDITPITMFGLLKLLGKRP